MTADQPSTTADELILEGIVTTLRADGTVNVSPMGPRVDRKLARFTLRPFQSSQTYQNLKRTGRGVFHVIDDVLLLARAAVGQLNVAPPMHPTPDGEGWILSDACRWFALEVVTLDDSAERVTIECRVTDQGSLRDFFGWNRAKHAVLEAAILATRVGILPADEIRSELRRLMVPLEKTAGQQEREAMQFLQQWVEQRLDS